MNGNKLLSDLKKDASELMMTKKYDAGT